MPKKPCAKPSTLRHIPDGVDYAQAASFTVGYLTAYVALVRRAELQKGEWLLVHGAAGGMGLAAVDLGKALGARVIATASTRRKARVSKILWRRSCSAVFRFPRGCEGDHKRRRAM